MFFTLYGVWIFWLVEYKYWTAEVDWSDEPVDREVRDNVELFGTEGFVWFFKIFEPFKLEKREDGKSDVFKNDE